jgi:CBS domain-containing protein
METSKEPPRLVRDLMTVGVETCSPDTPVEDLARRFLEKGIEEIVVLADGHALGVVGQIELLRAYARDDISTLKASDMMRESVPQVPPDIPLMAAAQIMLDLGVRTLFLMHHASGVEYPAAQISYHHYLRAMAASEANDLQDLGIYAQRRSPLETFIQRRDKARQAARSEARRDARNKGV